MPKSKFDDPYRDPSRHGRAQDYSGPSINIEHQTPRSFRMREHIPAVISLLALLLSGYAIFEGGRISANSQIETVRLNNEVQKLREALEETPNTPGGRIVQRIGNLERRISDIDKKLREMEAKATDQVAERSKLRIDSLEKRLSDLDARIAKMQQGSERPPQRDR